MALSSCHTGYTSCSARLLRSTPPPQANRDFTLALAVGRVPHCTVGDVLASGSQWRRSTSACEKIHTWITLAGQRHYNSDIQPRFPSHHCLFHIRPAAILAGYARHSPDNSQVPGHESCKGMEGACDSDPSSTVLVRCKCKAFCESVTVTDPPSTPVVDDNVNYRSPEA
jgi:hypothetical protein